MKVSRAKDQAVVAKDCAVADSLWLRMKGLLGKSSLGADAGIWIVPCNSVHTWFMRFSIDVVFLGKEQEVVAIYENMKPWRATRIIFRAKSVLELASGAVRRIGLQAGDRLLFGP